MPAVRRGGPRGPPLRPPPPRRRAAPVAFHARQPALGGPTSVAVHDDGDVSWRTEAIAEFRRRLGFGHVVLPLPRPACFGRGSMLWHLLWRSGVHPSRIRAFAGNR